MSKVLRAAVVVAAAGLAVPLWAVPANAETSSEAAATGAYFYRAGIDKPEGVAVDPRNVTAETTDGVAAEHLAVAVRQPGTDDKKSFLAFDLDAVPFDATITKAVMSVPLAENSPSNTQVSPAPEKVMACAAGPEGFNSQDGNSFTAAPTDTCDALKVLGKLSADSKAYVFDITGIAKTWLSEANNGVALRPAVSSAPFQVVFLPAPMATIAVDFTAPPAETEVEVVPVDAPTDVSSDTGGFASDPGSFDGGSVGAPDVAFGSGEAPVVDVGSLPVDAPAAPEPQTAAAPTGEVAIAPVALARPSEVMSPTAGAVLGGLLLAGLLALVSLIMGDPKVTTPGATTPTRLSLALQQRQATGATAGGARARLTPTGS